MEMSAVCTMCVCVCASIEWHDQLLLLLLLLPFHISITIAPLESIPYALNNTHNYSYIQFLLRPLLLLLLLILFFFVCLHFQHETICSPHTFMYVLFPCIFVSTWMASATGSIYPRLFECVDYTQQIRTIHAHVHTLTLHIVRSSKRFIYLRHLGGCEMRASDGSTLNYSNNNLYCNWTKSVQHFNFEKNRRKRAFRPKFKMTERAETEEKKLWTFRGDNNAFHWHRIVPNSYQTRNRHAFAFKRGRRQRTRADWGGGGGGST